MKKTVKQTIKKTAKKTETGKILSGTVLSTKMKDTIRVEVEHVVTHPIYKKQLKRTKSFSVHNTDTTIKEGDTVRIISTRPISKTKYFKVLEKVTL